MAPSRDLVLSDKELQEVEARCDAASPGPWRCTDWPWKDRPAKQIGDYTTERSVMSVPLKAPISLHRRCDAEFTAHARDDIPTLLREVRRLRSQEQRIRAAITGFSSVRVSVIQQAIDGEK